TILVLAALALAGDHAPGGNVSDAHRRLGLVHVLAAGAARAVHVGAQIRRIDLDVDIVVHLGRYEDGGERGMPAIPGIERRFAHQAMHAGLGPEPSIRIVAGHADGRTLDARDLARALVDD